MFIPHFGAWAAVVTTLFAEGIVGVGSLWIMNRLVRLPWWTIAAKPLVVCLAAALIGRYLACTFPTQWFLSLILITCGILVVFWVSERDFVVHLLRSVRKTAEPK
jgi:hypothetical protein